MIVANDDDDDKDVSADNDHDDAEDWQKKDSDCLMHETRLCLRVTHDDEILTLMFFEKIRCLVDGGY